MEFLAKTPKINFISLGKWAITLSLALVALTVYQWVHLGDAKYGTDFVGGEEFIMRFNNDVKVDSNKVTSLLQEAGYAEAVVQRFVSKTGNDYALRLPAEGGDPKAVTAKVHEALDKEYAGKYQELSKTFIGPTIGQELKRKAAIATALSLLAILLYITWRFEFAFALGAVVAVFHDVIISVGLYLTAGHNLNMLSLAAMLTIIGYSVNDTIVIFDRMREEIFKRKEYDLVPLMNECINVTLSRTIITSLLTLFAALALWLIGGGSIEDLSFFMVIGIIIGSYSTVFIATPIVLMWENFRNRGSKKAAAA